MMNDVCGKGRLGLEYKHAMVVVEGKVVLGG